MWIPNMFRMTKYAQFKNKKNTSPQPRLKSGKNHREEENNQNVFQPANPLWPLCSEPSGSYWRRKTQHEVISWNS